MPTAAPLREQEEQLKLISLHLHSEHGGLLIIASPDADAERALAEEVRLRISDEVVVEEVNLTPEPVERLNLFHHLSILPVPSSKAVVFIFGLDDLPPDARTTAIDAMNWGREQLRWTGYSVVLWVRPKTPGELGNRAPDFFSWRSDVFKFDLPTDPVERQRMLAQLRLFAPSTPDKLRQRYCDYVVRMCQWLDFRGLLQLRNVVRLPLEDVFVPLQATTASDSTPLPHLALTSEPSDVADRWIYERRRIGEYYITINDAVRRHQYLVVLGDPGSGKSTLLRFLALTFAQGKHQAQERLSINEDRLPILVPLSAFAEVCETQLDLSLAEFLPCYFMEQGLPDLSSVFDDALRSGHVFVLLDGLDEMLTYDDRATIARAVAEFVNSYPKARVVVTSRIAGYAPGMLPASFAMFTLAPFDNSAIERFAKQWSLAFEAIDLPSHAELPTDRRAMLRADSLTAAVNSHSGVQRLATNPLLLTLLALIHHQGTRFPHRRVDLYRLCVEALAETWNLARSLTGRPIDLRLGERRLDEDFVVRILAPVAYWMHETKLTGLVEREELEAHIAEQFVELEDISSKDATTLACDFVDLAREQMGLLVERAPDRFSFLHLSIQEYLAARFLSERMDGFERLKPRLHHPRWREVVLLTAGCLRGDYATTFVKKILNVHSPYDDLLHRDLLLAAYCVGDDVSVPPLLRQRIRDALFELWRHPPFNRLRDAITQTFAYLKGSVIGSDVLDFLLGIVRDRGERPRKSATRALGQVGQGDTNVVKILLSIVQDRTENKWMRRSATFALGQAGQGETQVVETLLRIVKDKSEDGWVRGSAVQTLGPGNADVVKMLLHIVKDRSEGKEVRSDAAFALGHAGPGNADVMKMLLHIVKDRNEDELVRWGAMRALEQAGQGETQVLKALLNIVQDRNEGHGMRGSAVFALGYAGQGNADVVKTLLNIVQDPNEDQEVCGNATLALGHAGQGNADVVKTLLNIVKDRSEDKGVLMDAAVFALGQAGQGKSEVVKTLLHVADDDPGLHDAALGALWDLLARGEGKGVNEPDD